MVFINNKNNPIPNGLRANGLAGVKADVGWPVLKKFKQLFGFSLASETIFSA